MANRLFWPTSGVIEMFAEKLKWIGSGRNWYSSSKLAFETKGMCTMRVNCMVFGSYRCETFTWKRSEA